MQKNYDVIIAGGGTSGCACAWMSTKLGLKTLLIEKNPYLGGAMTSQLVVPAMKTEHKNFNTDFFQELISYSHLHGAQITYADGNPGWFNPIKLPQILFDMLTEAGCDVILSAATKEVEKQYTATKYNNNTCDAGSKILSISIDSNYNDNVLVNTCYDKKYNDNIKNKKIEKFYAKFFVDATGDGNLSEQAGANFLPCEKSQAMSLRFIMEDVDKKAFADWLLKMDLDRNVTTAYEIDGDIQLSTACTWDLAPNWALKPLFDAAVNNGELKDPDRAYFQVFSVAGEIDKIAFNCPRIFADKDLDPLNNEDLHLAKITGKAVIDRLSAFCKGHFPGFENAKVCKVADSVGIRSSRMVKGKYVLTKEDIYNAKNFENPAAYSNYPIDVHSVKKDDYTLEYVQKTYAVPLESLMVEGFSNLFVIGRCLSADFYAQAAVRIQPTCFSMGESIAKYIKGQI